MSGTTQIDVWWARHTDAAAWHVSLLDDMERMRLARYRQDADRSRYLVAHALARLAIGRTLALPPEDIQFDRTCLRCNDDAHGKPHVAGGHAIQFSISHSGRWVVVAINDEDPVGIDVEEETDRHDPEELAPVILSESEQRWFYERPADQRRRDIVRSWARKEAILKATGDGLSVGPATITLTPPDAEPMLLSWTGRQDQAPVHLFDIDPDNDHLGCLAALGRRPAGLAEHDGSRLLSR